ncbi:MAG: glucoamylase family protein [Chitinophagaceae bacterium]
MWVSQRKHSHVYLLMLQKHFKILLAADSYLAIDQGPIIIMIDNYRTGLLWNLFTSCPEVKAGMRNLGFTAPYL